MSETVASVVGGYALIEGLFAEMLAKPRQLGATERNVRAQHAEHVHLRQSVSECVA